MSCETERSQEGLGGFCHGSWTSANNKEGCGWNWLLGPVRSAILRLVLRALPDIQVEMLSLLCVWSSGKRSDLGHHQREDGG